MTDALARLTAAIEHANQSLVWIEARQGPLPSTNYATIETDVQALRALRGVTLTTTGGAGDEQQD